MFNLRIVEYLIYLLILRIALGLFFNRGARGREGYFLAKVKGPLLVFMVLSYWFYENPGFRQSNTFVGLYIILLIDMIWSGPIHFCSNKTVGLK